jgi:hypothetical protein
MTKGFDRVVTALNKLLVGLGLVKEKVNEIPTEKEVHVRTVYTDDGNTTTTEEYARTGGMATSSGVEYFGRGGTVLQFVPRGSDTQPAMLTPGEMVLTRSQQSRLFHGGLGNEALHREVKGLRADLAEQAVQARLDRLFMQRQLPKLMKAANQQAA